MKYKFTKLKTGTFDIPHKLRSNSFSSILDFTFCLVHEESSAIFVVVFQKSWAKIFTVYDKHLKLSHEVL